VVTGFIFEGASCARPHPAILAALADPTLQAIVICPSNPFISIDPILAVPGIRDAITAAKAPLIVISPVIGGHAIKGPTAKMMAEFGFAVDVVSIAEHYRDIMDGYVIDTVDAREATKIDAPVEVTQTLMRDLADRENLARAVLAFASRLHETRSVHPAEGALS
jgi:LPPG:FO 2-phospho-L-lactate transferase